MASSIVPRSHPNATVQIIAGIAKEGLNAAGGLLPSTHRSATNRPSARLPLFRVRLPYYTSPPTFIPGEAIQLKQTPFAGLCWVVSSQWQNELPLIHFE